MAVNLAVQAGAAVVKSKTGRRILMAGLSLVLAVPAAAVALPVAVIYSMGSDSVHGLSVAGSVCGGGTAVVKPEQKIGAWGTDQLKIAATIITVGQSKGVASHGQQIAVMTAMGESSLQNLGHGDAVDNTTVGVFQQGASYGPRADRLDPAKAAAAFYTRLVGVAGWPSMDPPAAAARVQLGPPASHFRPFWPVAGKVVYGLTGGAKAACVVPADAKTAAGLLVVAIRSGKLIFLERRYEQQVVNMANGTATPACQINVAVLRIMVIAVNNFDQVGVSDLNRRCTGSTVGAGTASAHWKGKAVDFYALNKRSLTGSDPLSLQLIHLLDPLVPSGSGLGQAQCRAGAGDSVGTLVNFTMQFADTCDHQHVQVP